ncbi:MAG: hypothetical protein K0R13_2094 [Propionibacteriaceae bacterium]|nr:hypothetical protein [Propionibacteriaceae bacterium]
MGSHGGRARGATQLAPTSTQTAGSRTTPERHCNVAGRFGTADQLSKSGRGLSLSDEMSSRYDLGRLSTSQARLSARNAVAASNGGVPRRRGLGAAGKCVEIHLDKSPALAVAGGPFKVVQQ